MRSTGPRTIAGKARSRRNAFKHGLSIPMNCDDAVAEQVKTFAIELAALFAKPREIARMAAEAELEVTRVQQAKVDLINRSVAQEAGKANDAPNNEACIASAVAAALPDLMPLMRYERRALSRLRKIRRSFEKQ